MAGTTTFTRSATHSFGKALAGFFTGIGHFLVTLAESSEKMRRLEHLSRQSDAELEARGLTRAGEIQRIVGTI